MKLVTKPVTLAGFFTSALIASFATAQNYIDVEAEREAARRASEATSAPSVQEDSGSGYSASGIKPYSGQTTAAAPVPAVNPSASQEMNVGSLVIQLQQLQEEVMRLNGLVEQQSAEISRLKKQSLDRYVDLDRRIAGIAVAGNQVIGGAPSVDSVTNGDGLTFGGVGSDKPPALEPGEESAYQSAYGYVKTKNFTEAVEGFKQFLQKFPYGRYAPNAHYWLGELYLVIDPAEPELARQSFQLLLDQYPSNAKIPDALYKLGKVHYLKGNSERSREYLDRVITGYPGHPAAQLATDFLSENF
ncbi:MAG: tol-pal system protein YbgF [Cellvibrionales bacterium]|nr:tol-pal system protein YbgF [Cellvibrionales bacterium]